MGMIEQPTNCNNHNCLFYKTFMDNMPEHKYIFYKEQECSLEDILHDVSEASGVSIEEIAGQSRKGNIIVARQMFCYVARQKNKFKFRQIGKIIGKDHSTVINSVKTVKDMLQTRSSLEHVLLAIKLDAFRL